MLKAVARAASGLRGRLGESLASIQKLNYVMEQATTASLEAFQAYSRGEAQRSQGRWMGAIPFYQRAVELDPNFATGFARLGVMYGNVGEMGRAAENIQKAFALVNRVTEREKLYISSHYYRTVTRELDKAIEVYRLYSQTYPRDAAPTNNLGVIYSSLGEMEKAAEQFREAMRQEPRMATSYGNLLSAYTALDRPEEAKAIAQRAFDLKLESATPHVWLLRIALQHGDSASAERELQWLAGKPEEFQARREQALSAQYAGQWRKAKQWAEQGRAIAARQRLTQAVAAFLVQEALGEAGPRANRRKPPWPPTRTRSS